MLPAERTVRARAGERLRSCRAPRGQAVGGPELVSDCRGGGKPAVLSEPVLDHPFKHRETGAPADDLRVNGEHDETARVSVDEIIDLVLPHLLNLAGIREQGAVLRRTVVELELREVREDPHEG